MTRVTRIRGVAGAGKTTETMRRVRKLRDEHGYGPRDFRFLSFSRSHAADLRGDVLEAWGDRLDEMGEDEIEELKDNVSTLHSLCSQLTLTTTIITPESDEEFYHAFWSSRGFEFDTDDVDAQFISPEEMESGERNRVQKLLAADQLLAQLGAGLEGEGIDLEPSAIRHIPVEINLRAARIIDLIEDWRDFKREHGVKEHHDYVLDAANASYTPDCKVLVVDEMQDYSPLEYSVVRDWIDSGDLDHAILAGDENQSIYSFRLADPRYFTGREVDEEVVLTESYRCPRKVCEVARRVCPGSNITPAQKDDGIFMDATITNEDQLGRLVQQLLGAHPTHPNGSDSPSLFILTRTNRQAAKVGWGLRQAGIPYTPTDEGADSPWSDDVIEAIKVLRAVAEGRSAMPAESADVLIEMATNSEERREIAESPDFGGLETSSASAIDIWTAFPSSESVEDIVRSLDVKDYVQDMIAGAMQSDADLDPDRVEVGTIHSVKGREAPAVVVMDGYPHKLAERYELDDEFAAEEDRLAYVAATRASQTLVVAREFLGGESFAPFASSQISLQNQPEKGMIHDD